MLISKSFLEKTFKLCKACINSEARKNFLMERHKKILMQFYNELWQSCPSIKLAKLIPVSFTSEARYNNNMEEELMLDDLIFLNQEEVQEYIYKKGLRKIKNVDDYQHSFIEKNGQKYEIKLKFGDIAFINWSGRGYKKSRICLRDYGPEFILDKYWKEFKRFTYIKEPWKRHDHYISTCLFPKEIIKRLKKTFKELKDEENLTTAEMNKLLLALREWKNIDVVNKKTKLKLVA